MKRWRLKLTNVETGTSRYGDVLYSSASEAARAAEDWTALQLEERAQMVEEAQREREQNDRA